MNNVDKQYLDLCKDIIDNGKVRSDRTGTGTISVFDRHMRFDLTEGFPLLTTKFVPFRVTAVELLWFLSKSDDIKYLLDNNVHIWDDDAYRFYLEQGGELNKEDFLKYAQEHGFSLNGVYGVQWRNWNEEGIDQINNIIETIKKDPDSRRLVLSAWNPSVVDKVALPSCHCLVEFYVEEGKLSCKFTMRSNDIPLGNPINIASYALLTHIIAKMTDLEVGDLSYSGGNVHVYLNQVEGILEQLKREPYDLPQLIVKTKHDDISKYTLDDFELVGYKHHPRIKFPLSVGLKEESK